MPYTEFNSALSASLMDNNAMTELNPRTRKESRHIIRSRSGKIVRYDFTTELSFISENLFDAVFNSIKQRKAMENRMVSRGLICIIGV